MKTLLELAQLVNGKVIGDEALIISGISEIQNGVESTITFLSNQRYRKYLSSTQASAIIVDDPVLLKNKSGIIHDNPQLAIAKILGEFSPKKNNKISISKNTHISPKAIIGKNISIGHFSVIEDDVVIGDNTIIGSNTIISSNSSIGKNCNIFSNIHIYNHSTRSRNVSHPLIILLLVL